MRTHNVCLVTTYNRPIALRRSLPQIAALGWRTLVVDDGSEPHGAAEANEDVTSGLAMAYLRLPENRGLACALNVGLEYWLADKSIEWISVFQDDVDVHLRARQALEFVRDPQVRPLLTGHDAGEHAAGAMEIVNGVAVRRKANCRATHLHAHRDYWRSVMPIPTRELGAPKRMPGQLRGLGSNVDHWIVRDAPNAAKEVWCIPNLVRSFHWRADQSFWGDEARAEEEPPLSAAALRAVDASGEAAR